MSASPLFDAYIMVDWSAASRPVTGANAIWIAVLLPGEGGRDMLECTNPATRAAAEAEIETRVKTLMTAGKNVLLGFDFALGYPAGTAERLGLTTDLSPWAATCSYLETHIHDGADNRNNRFALAADMNQALSGMPHPFWGAPKTQICATLAATKGDFNSQASLPEHRAAEAWIKSNYKASPKSVWQLLGIGSVGSQSLLGIPRMNRLRRSLPNCRVWPFETGLTAPIPNSEKGPHCIIAEIYPSTLDVSPQPQEIMDRAQVRSLATRFFQQDSAGQLATAFHAPNSLDRRILRKIEAEEGWILAI